MTKVSRSMVTMLVFAAGFGGLASETSAAAPSPVQVYVAPWGKDSWAGTLARPFATLQRAQQLVRSKTARMRSDIVVNLHAGAYTLAAPLRLSDAGGDSGRNGYRVIYQALGYGTSKARPVTVSGGREVSGWQLVDPAKGLWRAEAGSLDTRQLFVDGRRARRAELGSPIPGNWTLTEDGYVTDSTAPQSWKNPRDIEIAFKWRWYNEPRCGVDRISGDANSTTIRMDQPCFRWARNLFSGQFLNFPPLTLAFLPPYPENSQSFLSAPGTFYLDRSRPGRHVLYYMARPGENLSHATVVAPVLEQLVTGETVHDVTIRGLTFTHSTWLEPNQPTGFVQFFAGLYEGGEPPLDNDPFNVSADARSMPGSVAFHGSKRIVIERNRFTQLGSQAVELSLGSSGNVVQGNVIADVSGGGVEVGNRYPGDGDRINPSNRVSNNWVHDIGVEYPGSVGIYLEMTQDSTASHNQVNGVPYSGIVFGQYWLQGEATLNRGAQILDNKVFDTLNGMSDGGGIWTAAPQGTSFANGAVVSGNWTYDNVGVDSGGIGLYTDDDSSYVTLRRNVTYRNGSGSHGGCLPVTNLLFTQNFWDVEQGVWVCGELPDSVVETDNSGLSADNPEQACAAIPACAAIVANAGLEAPYRDLLSE